MRRDDLVAPRPTPAPGRGPRRRRGARRAICPRRAARRSAGTDSDAAPHRRSMGTVSAGLARPVGPRSLGRCTLRRPATRRNRRSVADPPPVDRRARGRGARISPQSILRGRSRVAGVAAVIEGARGARSASASANGSRCAREPALPLQISTAEPGCAPSPRPERTKAPMRRPSSVWLEGLGPAGGSPAIGPREVQLATLGQERIRRESQYRDRDHGQRLEGDLDHRSAASAGHMSRVQSARGAASPHPRPSTDGAAGHGSARPSPERRRFRGARRADARRLCRGNAHAERTYDRLGFREIA